jgi:hypothetical protein
MQISSGGLAFSFFLETAFFKEWIGAISQDFYQTRFFLPPLFAGWLHTAVTRLSTAALSWHLDKFSASYHLWVLSTLFLWHVTHELQPGNLWELVLEEQPLLAKLVLTILVLWVQYSRLSSIEFLRIQRRLRPSVSVKEYIFFLCSVYQLPSIYRPYPTLHSESAISWEYIPTYRTDVNNDCQRWSTWTPATNPKNSLSKAVGSATNMPK